MPITYAVDHELKIVRTEARGPIKVTEIVTHLACQKRDKTLPYREILDVSNVSAPYMTSSQIWQAAQAVLAMTLESRPGPRAILVTNDAVYGMCRMFATLVEETFPIRVFRENEAAEHWLMEEYQLDVA
jgi:hypothetical protein